MIVAFYVRVFLVPQLMRDLLGFGVNQRRRQVKADLFVQRVQQVALHHSARSTGVFCFQTLSDLTLQRFEILGTEFLGHLVVDLGRDGLFHFFDGASEGRFLTGQMLGLILFGEVHDDGLFFARLNADQLLFEARDEGVRTQNQRVIFGSATFEFFTVDGAFEVDHNLIAVFRFGALFAGFEVLCGFGKACQRFFDGGFVGLDHHLFQLDLAQIDFWNFGQFFVSHGNFDVIAFFPVFVGHFDFGLHRGAVAGCLKMLCHGAIDAFLHRFAHDPLAELLFQQRHRNLALAEALHFDFGLRFGQLFVDLGFQFGGGHGDVVTAFQTFVQRLVDLHVCSIG